MTPEEACGRELMHTLIDIRRLEFRMMQLPQLTPGEFMIMRSIDQCEKEKTDATARIPDPPGVRISTLSRRMRHAPPSVSQMVGNLEKQGFVERATLPSDRRAVFVHLTEDGYEVMDRCSRYMDGLSGRIISKFGLQEARSLTKELTRLYRCMESVEQEEPGEGKQRPQSFHRERKAPPLW